MKTDIAKPPKWISEFFHWFCKPEYWEDIQGDLEEEFGEKASSSVFKARSWYFWQVVKLFKPTFIKQLKVQNSIQKETTMLQSYLKIGWRNIRKYKSSSAINIIGLSVGIASFIMIALFVTNELSYDKHFREPENIYRVTVKNYDSEGQISRQWAFASAGHAERLKEDYSSIEYATRFMPWAFPDLQYEDKKFPGEQVVFTDEDVFNVFDFEFIIGDPETALNDIVSMVLTESSAIKIFGNDWRDQQILGKTITLSRDDQQAPFKVTGVMKDMPEEQHFHFDYLAPIRFISQLYGEDAMNNVGGNYNWLTYIRVKENTDPDQLTVQMNEEFWDKYMGELNSGNQARDFYDFELQNILDIHLHSNLEGEIETNGSYQQVLIFSVIGILLLIIACINYMNLATSHYSRRMKEVGVRKVVGAFKSSLIKQFLTESTLITFISLPIAIGLVYWALPYLNNFMDKSLTFGLSKDIGMVLFLFGLLLFVGIIAGTYPALFLSRVNLVQALKGEQSVNAKKWNFRSFLVIFQYAVTIGLIFSLLVIESQLSFIRNADPGYNKEQLLHVELSRNIQNTEVFKREMLNHPNIKEGTFASRVPTGRLADSWGSSIFKGDSLSPTSFRLPFIQIDEDFVKTFDIPLIAGENFSRDQHMVEDSIGYYIINRKAAESFGYNNPEEIIGKRLSYGPFNGQTFKIGRIQGVTENFHFESMHTEIAPMVMLKADWNYRRLVLKIDPDDISGTLKHVENTWAEFDPVNSVSYRFLDEMFDEQYRQEERLSTMIKVFTVIAALIGCLGLIGLVGFVIETKIKEIGIRKVLGASTKSILILVSNRFMILMIVGFALAVPLAYWLMSGWLENFVYRTQIGLLIVFTPFVLATIITLLSIGYQTIKASRVNPVECLKDE